jgi:hypothetical protein
VLDRDRLAPLGRQPDEALADGELDLSHGADIQTDGRREHQLLALEVEGVDGAHVGVEALRHELGDVGERLLEIV